jgi:hypothetical protein
MIEQIIVPTSQHPTREDCGYHFMIDAFSDGTADLLAVKDTGSGWGESGTAADIIRSARRLAWELSDAGYRVVISYFLQTGADLPRGRATLRRVK